MMGRKSSANEGPVHSPIGRRHAKQQKDDQTGNTTEQTKNQTSKRKATKNKNKGVIAGDHIAHCKRKWLCIDKSVRAAFNCIFYKRIVSSEPQVNAEMP